MWTSNSNTSISSPDKRAVANAITVGSLLRRISCMPLHVEPWGADVELTLICAKEQTR